MKDSTMKKNVCLFLSMLLLLCSSHHIQTGIFSQSGHKDIKAWRRAARNNTLAKHNNAMKKMNTSDFDGKFEEIRKEYDGKIALKISSKKTYFGFFKVGLGTLFGFSTGFFTYKALPACLQLEDEQARVTATFWCAMGALASLSGSCFFLMKGSKNIVNNYDFDTVKARLESHSIHLNKVRERFYKVKNEAAEAVDHR